MNQYQLPNGQWIYHLNSYETDFVYEEIFVNNTYLKHNIEVPNDAVIFDIGANIGLFSLYLKNNFHNSKIYAFEPSPDVYKILNLNMASFENSVQIYNCGLLDEDKNCTFYYYPEYSVISGFHVDNERDAEIIISGMKNNSANNHSDIENLVKKRLKKLESFNCQVTTISHIIQQTQLTTVDLLKIDAEGAELAILNGIAKTDWGKIKQITMEVHKKDDLSKVAYLLKSKSFNIVIEEDKQLKEIYSLFAIRK